MFRGKLLSFVENDTIVFGLEPFHDVVLDESVLASNTSRLVLLVSNVQARSAENNVEIHTVNTNGRIMLDIQINVPFNEKLSRRNSYSLTLSPLSRISSAFAAKALLDERCNAQRFSRYGSDGVSGLEEDWCLTG